MSNNPSDGTERVGYSSGANAEDTRTNDERSAGDVFLSAVVILGRVIQFLLVGTAAIFVFGSLEMPIFAAAFVWIFALVLLAFAIVVQAVIGGIKARAGGSGE